MRVRRSILTLLLSAGTFVGCDSTDGEMDVDPFEGMADYFPIEDGPTWSFDYRSSSIDMNYISGHDIEGVLEIEFQPSEPLTGSGKTVANTFRFVGERTLYNGCQEVNTCITEPYTWTAEGTVRIDGLGQVSFSPTGEDMLPQFDRFLPGTDTVATDYDYRQPFGSSRLDLAPGVGVTHFHQGFAYRGSSGYSINRRR